MDLQAILDTTQDAPVISEIVDVLCNKTQNTDRGFYKVEVAYFIGKVAGCMRASLVTKDRGKVPINIYAIALASSGYGKGHSVSIMENSIIKGFKRRFLNETLPLVSDAHLDILAQERALKTGKAEDLEKDVIQAEFNKLGAYPFTFDSGTAPAVKQLRDKLLLANCGSINLQIDEIGSNLIGATEVLNIFLELYDQGVVKQKLVKNTVDNSRSEDRDGSTPTNCLLFGTPAKLLDGSSTEDEFYSFLEIGYARRCLFGIGKADKRAIYSMDPAEIYKKLIDPANSSTVDKWCAHFSELADPSKINWQIEVPDEVSIELIAYKSHCEKIANALPDHEAIKQAEISHRYFKALKLAGALAFVDQAIEMSMTHLHQAIKLVEESGKAFESILTRDRSFMRLAKYIASTNTEVTHADLTEDLPFYKSGTSARNEMLSLAIAWGYKNHILIKKSLCDGIEFFKGETLKPTDINKLILSYSTDMAFNYEPARAQWDQMKNLCLADGYHWCNHQFMEKHRCNECVIQGFNMVVVDVDGTSTINTVQELFKDYKYILYTTKRHGQDGKDRFRLILPINYELKMDLEDYREFMNNLLKWLPFQTDECANQASKKWLTNGKAQYFTNEGQLLDALKFIPRTKRNEDYLKETAKIENLGNLERWFLNKISQGNRNNNMFKYAMALVDNGNSYQDVVSKVKALNKQLQAPLSDEELDNSIYKSVAKRYV